MEAKPPKDTGKPREPTKPDLDKAESADDDDETVVKALEDDEKFIFKAAAAAQKAVSFLSQYSGSVESTEHDVQPAL